ncbi:MAG TPA: sugar phosphate isomerase/epimerase family protein, partial [Methanocella sp.]|nr:sugar phosphate isomerase/epimerase family protein [Methanocella sp.]
MNDKRGFKLGFSTLSIFMRPPESWSRTALEDHFNALEILCEGPMWPRHGLWRESLKNGDGLDVYLHSPTVDLNPASINKGIRDETLRQLKEAVDMAAAVGAPYVTTHPGIIHKPIPRIWEMCREYAAQVLGEAADYAKGNNVVLSIENMPLRNTYLCTSAGELDELRRRCGSGVTIDVGHAITCPDPASFLRLPHISYLHVNDNMGDKDAHLCPGDGILDLNLLRAHDR